QYSAAGVRIILLMPMEWPASVGPTPGLVNIQRVRNFCLNQVRRRQIGLYHDAAVIGAAMRQDAVQKIANAPQVRAVEDDRAFRPIWLRSTDQDRRVEAYLVPRAVFAFRGKA